MFSISSNDDDIMLKQSDSRGSYLSSKPSLSDIYERSDEGDLEKKNGSAVSVNGLSSAANSFNVTGSQSRWDRLPTVLVDLEVILKLVLHLLVLFIFSSPELTLSADSYSVSPCHSTKSSGGRLHLSMHTPLTQQSRSGLTMPLGIP